MHVGELVVTLADARRLIAASFPELAGRELRIVDGTGTLNTIVRIGTDGAGDGLAARFPLLREDAASARATLEREADAAREAAAVSPVPAPVPVGIGRPDAAYPMPWSVVTWVTGSDLADERPARAAAGSVQLADDLARLVGCFRAVDTVGRLFTGDGRGGDLRGQDRWLATCLQESERLLDVPRLRALWERLVRLPVVEADAMCHGDLTPSNLLVEDGRLVGVLDTGGFAAADPALDLIVGWHVLERGPRRRFRELLDIGDTSWARGAAWALAQALGLVWYYERSNPRMAAWGRATIERILAADADGDLAAP